MAVVSMKQLLEAGVHFGHQTRRWNPKMAKYIFTERNGIYIIDLQKTVKKLDEAYNFVRDMAAEGGSILFVGTKKQAQESIREEATRCGMHYVNARWLGGMLTNFRTIRRRIDRMEQIKKMREDGTFDMLPKKEVAKLELELEKLEKFLGGVKDDGQAAQGHVHCGPAQGAHRRCRGPQAEHPHRGHCRHQLRSGRDRLCHSRQRRRNPRREADRGRNGGRRAGGPSGRADGQRPLQRKQPVAAAE